ncbi:oligosaccharide flippase family protein, partial [Nitrospirota bacterium]
EQDETHSQSIRSAMWITAALSGLLSAFSIIIFREPLSLFLFNSESYSGYFFALAAGVFAFTLSMILMDTFNAFRKVEIFVQANIISSLIAAIAAITAIYYLREQGIIFFVISVPVTTLIVAALFTPAIKGKTSTFSLTDTRIILAFGVPIMFSTIVPPITQIMVRWYLNNQMDIISVGYYQAAWNISTLYMGFLMRSLLADYFPSLSGKTKDHSVFNRTVNEQVTSIFFFAIPVVLIMILLAKPILFLLYSNSFGLSVNVLKLHLYGDLLKLPGWALGFAMLALGRNRDYLFIAIIEHAIYFACIVVGLERFGLSSTGYSAIMSKAILFIVYFMYLRRSTGFIWSTQNYRLMSLVAVIGISLMTLSMFDGLIFLMLQYAIVTVFCAYAFSVIWKHFKTKKTLINRRSKD